MDTPAFLYGKKTILRPYNPTADLELFTKWFNDPDTQQFMSGGLFPLPVFVEEERARKIAEKENTVFLVVETKENITIGTVGLHNINWVNRTATTGACIGEKDYRSMGYGTDAKMHLLHHAFTRLNLRQIRASVLAFNKRSHRALIKQGYQEVGRLPNWYFKNGCYHDEIIMVLTKQQFMSTWKKYIS